MSGFHYHFEALLQNLEPPTERKELARDVPASVRDFLESHSFKTASPHSRLTGSYFRDTAVLEIKDVDILVFVPQAQRDRTPNAVLLDLKKALDDYPDATAEASGQRRSVRLTLKKQENLQLDLVPAFTAGDIHDPLEVPERTTQEWISSNPLGYSDLLSDLNGDHAQKVVRLIKLFKGWRSVQMKTRKPKSYVLEAIVYYAVRDGKLLLKDQSWETIVAGLFGHVWSKYEDLYEQGKESPRIPDPGLEHLDGYADRWITKGWERSHFETFMRRIDESRKRAERALDPKTKEPETEWAEIFGDYWPTEDAVKSAAKVIGLNLRPGSSQLSSAGLVVGGSDCSRPSRDTRYWGGGER